MVKSGGVSRKIGFAFLILLIVLFSVFPFIQALSTSLKYQWDWGNPSLIPTQINLEAYKELLNIGQEEKSVPESVKNLLDESDLTKAQRDEILAKYKETGDVFPFLKYFRNSLALSTTGALLSVVLAIMGAYSFSRLRYRGRGLIQRGVLFVYMIGGILLLIPLYRIAVAMGLLATPVGTFLALLIIYLVQTLPVSLYLLGNFFRSIPYSIEEAALIDGLARHKIIWRIVIPLSWSAIVTVFIYAFMIAWNEYLFASVFLKSYDQLYTLPMGLRALFYSKNAIWDRIMAGSMLTATPVIILFMAIQKNLTGGLSEGGVKG
ncbi:Inner membrane ABC transporter permease protein YcjP [Olavius algarvensis spirochete endosymbiont]|uniref:carbohydrate ABC transporter permease n=1 Tax=Olavius algarvensis spirochete endosymbiont TaxID=260710 RepID=UPI00052BF596|nr:carbohydrate ABC transporter permease [Olavius algarvensis spirochete endosymbiont]KGM38787.1 ABC transporter permease [Alkalispirochaeta odontotermitis]VDB00175.1 Inner membrane ABC transporter permease protein YcjP [Olavius algarvensis spirochete endosymbiont]